MQGLLSRRGLEGSQGLVICRSSPPACRAPPVVPTPCRRALQHRVDSSARL